MKKERAPANMNTCFCHTCMRYAGSSSSLRLRTLIYYVIDKLVSGFGELPSETTVNSARNTEIRIQLKSAIATPLDRNFSIIGGVAQSQGAVSPQQSAQLV